MIRSIARLSSRAFQLILVGLLAVLMVALGWTALKLASLRAGEDSLHSTIKARASLYRQTATAISDNDDSASLDRWHGFVLMQQQVDRGSSSASPTPSKTGPALTPTPPDDFPLPKLLIPLDPADGAQLAGTLVPTRVPPLIRQHPLVNIMLLGSDEEVSEDDFIRTDTMIIVSLNLETGTAAMLSLPRDLLVYIPSGTMARLNTAYGLGEKLSWQPGGGFGLLRQTLFYNFGINVHYHARVNFSGFEAIIDRLGGIDMAVFCAYRDLFPQPDGGYDWRTLPAGYYSFDGQEALWYARTRNYTDDFDRGRRQQQILRAIWRKARQQGLLVSLPSLWTELTQIAHTDMPLDVMLRLLPFVIELDLDAVENLALVKHFHTSEWTMPDGAEVLLPNAKPVAALMQDFYLPPAANQQTVAGPSIAVYDAAGAANWDIVAAQRLRWDGHNALALGEWREDERLASSVLHDFVVTAKGSLTGRILKALNLGEEQVVLDARADREYDYRVLIGEDYQSCTYGVLPIDE